MDLKLIYPGFCFGDPPRAEAIATNVRETKTMYIVNQDNVTITYSSGIRFGSQEQRFRKATGRAVGTINSWRIRQ